MQEGLKKMRKETAQSCTGIGGIGVSRGYRTSFSFEVSLRGSPIRRISHRISVSWMLLLANGHSCLSSRLLFSKTN